MRAGSRNIVLVRVVLMAGIALTGSLAWPQTAGTATSASKAAGKAVQPWTKLTVDLPTSSALFPAGNGADIANGQCLICHSAGMALRQPPLTEDEWRGVINKMRNVYGAPIPAEQVDALAGYLHAIDGR